MWRMQEGMFYKQMGERLRRTRESRKLSREQLAGLSDLSTKFLYEIENGRKGISCMTLQKLCKALQVNADYLMEGIGENTNRMRIEYLTRDFDTEEMEYLLKVIEGICGFRNTDHQDKIS